MGSLRNLKNKSGRTPNKHTSVHNSTKNIVTVTNKVKHSNFLASATPVSKWAFIMTLDSLPNVELYVSSVGPLYIANDVTFVKDQGSEVAVAGKQYHSSISVEIREYEAFDILGQLLQWRQKVISNTNLQDPTLSNPSSYKCDGSLRFMTGVGNTLGSPITLLGCWPSSIEVPQLSYASTDLVSIRAVIEIDSIA